jgi:hypothetical protein
MADLRTAGTSKTMSGGRGKCYVNGVLVGIFESCNTSRSYGTEAIHTLGKFGPQEVVYTSAEQINVSCSGFRVIDAGVHTLKGGSVPTVGQLLTFEPFVISIVDRQSGKTVRVVEGCVPTQDNDNFNAKATSKVTINYVGTVTYDESGPQNEGDTPSFP